MDWSKDFVIKRYGGIVNESKLKDVDCSNVMEVRKLFLQIQSRMLNDSFFDTPDEIELILINNKDFIAFLRSDKNNYAICISMGMLRAIWNLLLMSLCDPDIFLGYPEDAKINYIPKKKITLKLLQGPALIPSHNFPESDTRHQNITIARRQLCQMLFSAVLDYILYHECMHISRNHFLFFRFIRNDGEYNETFLKKQNSRIFQLLEADADLLALSYSLKSHPEVNSAHAFASDQKNDFFFGFLFSYIIIQQLFDFTSVSNNSIEEGLHPKPIKRALLCSNLLKAYFIQHGLASSKDLDDQENKAWYEASTIARKLQFPAGRWHGDEMTDVTFEEINLFIAQYNEFAELIDKCNELEDYSDLQSFMYSIS